MPKLPPIPTRDSGGMFRINNPDDGTPIKQMYPWLARLDAARGEFEKFEETCVVFHWT